MTQLSSQALEKSEFRSRVLHSLLTPVVTLARRFGISMK